MKVAALAALGVLIVLPANAGQQQRQYASPATTCDNDGHCTTLASAFPAIHKIRPKAPKAAAAVVPQLPQPRPAQIDAQSPEDPQSQQRSQEPQQAEQQSGQSQDQQQMKQEQQPEQAQQTRQAQQSQPPSQQPHALDANGNSGGYYHFSQNRRPCSCWCCICRALPGLHRRSGKQSWRARALHEWHSAGTLLARERAPMRQSSGRVPTSARRGRSALQSAQSGSPRSHRGRARPLRGRTLVQFGLRSRAGRRYCRRVR
mgnify:CR=1 FL=1